MVFGPRLGDPLVYQSPTGVCECHFLGQVLRCAFVGMVKYKFLARFPVDHLAHPVMSSLVLLPCQFGAFAYYVIVGFISVTTECTFAILLRLIYPRFDIIGSYGTGI